MVHAALREPHPEQGHELAADPVGALRRFRASASGEGGALGCKSWAAELQKCGTNVLAPFVAYKASGMGTALIGVCVCVVLVARRIQLTIRSRFNPTA